MTEVNPKNGKETKSDIFPWDIFKSDIICHILKNISMTFIISTFQSHCKIEHNQAKQNKITHNMVKCDSIFPYLKNSDLFLDKVCH